MPERKRLIPLPEQKRLLVEKAAGFRGEIGLISEELVERWKDPHSHWWLLAATAARNLIFSQLGSKWERGLAALYTTWNTFARGSGP